MSRPEPAAAGGWQRPHDLEAALGLLAGGALEVLAGGTDLFAARVGRPAPTDVLDLSAIASLRGLSDDRMADGRPAWRIGATTTWSDLVAAATDPSLKALVQAAREVGGRQVQNRGTVGGNLVNASPAADGAPVLMALGAEVELARAGATRRLPVDQFLLGVRRTALAPGELLVSVRVPKGSSRAWSRFLKLGHRRYLVISIVMVAVRLDFDEQGRVAGAGVAVGACAPTARRLSDLERALVGAGPAALSAIARSDRIEQALAALAPIDDVRGSARYRADAAAIALRRLLDEAATTGVAT